MVVVKNIDDKDLLMPFEGKTYRFPKKAKVRVKENVYRYMKELWPLAFEWNVKVNKKEVIPNVMSKDTPSFTEPGSVPGPVNDMRATVAGEQVSTYSPEGGTLEIE